MKIFQSALTTGMFLLTFLLVSPTAQAECLVGCQKTLKTRSGTVYGGGPAKTTFKATGNTVKISVTKKGGRAQTIVNIYVNGRMQQGKSLTFQNGNYSNSTKVTTISGVRNKDIRVDIVNQSVGNKFEYSMKATTETNALGSGQGNLAGQGKKTISLSTSCDNNARIIVRRTGGTAKAIVKVMSASGQSLNGGGVVIDKNQSSKVINIPNARNRRLKVEVKNVSVGNFFKFSMTASSN